MWHDLILDVDLICTNAMYNLTIPMLVQSIIYAYVVPSRLAQMIVHCAVTNAVAPIGFYWGRGQHTPKMSFAYTIHCLITLTFSVTYIKTQAWEIFGAGQLPPSMAPPATCHVRKYFGLA